MRIGAKEIGPDLPCFIIAEVGLQHDGSLGQAHAYIDAIAEAGADAVKFQCHLACESHPGERWRVEPPWPQDKGRFYYWIRTSFTPHEWEGLAQHAHSLGLEFLCSPFSVEAVRLLDPLVPAWKIASGEIAHTELLEAIADTGKPVLISTGMATMREIDEVQHFFACRHVDVQMLQCTSKYPCPPEQVGLWEAAALGGLSDHSGEIWTGLGAVALGVQVLEVHVCWDFREWGFDVKSAVTLDDLADLVTGARMIERAKTVVNKDAMAVELGDMRELFMEKWRRAGA